MLRTKLKNTPTTVSNFFLGRFFFREGVCWGKIGTETRLSSLQCRLHNFLFPLFLPSFSFSVPPPTFFARNPSFLSTELLPAINVKARSGEGGKREREKKGVKIIKSCVTSQRRQETKKKKNRRKIFLSFFPLLVTKCRLYAKLRTFLSASPQKKLYVRGTFQCFSFGGNYRTYVPYKVREVKCLSPTTVFPKKRNSHHISRVLIRENPRRRTFRKKGISATKMHIKRAETHIPPFPPSPALSLPLRSSKEIHLWIGLGKRRGGARISFPIKRHIKRKTGKTGHPVTGKGGIAHARCHRIVSFSPYLGRKKRKRRKRPFGDGKGGKPACGDTPE